MGRVFAVGLLIILILTGAYAVIALRDNDSTDAVVKLLGPGMTPPQCEKRIRPHFDRIEPAMTEIASTLIESPDFSEVMLSFGDDTKFFVTESTTGKVVLKSAEDVSFDPQLFHSLKDAGYYAAGNFRIVDGVVQAQAIANCGVPLYQWIRLRLGLGWTSDSEKLPVAVTGYLYNPDGFEDVDLCPATVTDPDPVVFCQVRLSEKWLWALQYYDFAQLEAN